MEKKIFLIKREKKKGSVLGPFQGDSRRWDEVRRRVHGND